MNTAIINRKNELLNGELIVPNKVFQILKPNKEEKELMQDMFNHLYYNFLREKMLDTLIYYERFEYLNKDLFNKFIYILEESKWIKSRIEMNYAFIELLESRILKYITKEELIELRRKLKYKKYEYGYIKSTFIDIVKRKDLNELDRTGLVRKGFCKASNNVFTYDTKMLHEHISMITENLKKGLQPTEKDISYQSIIDHLIKYHSDEHKLYNFNQCILDSRGRAISQCMKKILNPISNKEARALICIQPRPLDEIGYKYTYLAISELLGYKPSTLEEKIELGINAYNKRLLPEYNGDNLHEYIWLSRLYNGLDNPKYFNVPIENDATASMLQMMGILTNTHKYLYGTNLAENNNKLQDIWTIDGLPRNFVKKAMTPILYGSFASITQLWDKHKFEYNKDHLKIMLKEIAKGRFKEANNFKDFLINNSHPSNVNKMKILDDNFLVYCNKFKWNETTPKEYEIYSEGRVKIIAREVERVPDLNRFKVSMPTLLCHNLDSQVANYICNQNLYVLPIHDCFDM